MEIVRRLLGVFLVVIAIVVAINLMATPLYHDGSEDYPIWKIVNWFMGDRGSGGADSERHEKTRAGSRGV